MKMMAQILSNMVWFG